MPHLLLQLMSASDCSLLMSACSDSPYSQVEIGTECHVPYPPLPLYPLSNTLLFPRVMTWQVEIGTECGGSALFFATLMRQYTTRGHVLTYDVEPTWRR